MEKITLVGLLRYSICEYTDKDSSSSLSLKTSSVSTNHRFRGSHFVINPTTPCMYKNGVVKVTNTVTRSINLKDSFILTMFITCYTSNSLL